MVEQQVLKVVAYISGWETVDVNATLEEDLGLDSLDKVDLINEMEEEFGLSFDDDPFFACQSVRDIVAYVSSKVRPLDQ